MKQQRFRFKLAALLLIGLLALAGIYGVRSVEEYGTRLMQTEEAAETTVSSAPDGSPDPAAETSSPRPPENTVDPSFPLPPDEVAETPSPAPPEDAAEASGKDDSGWHRIHSPSSGE